MISLYIAHSVISYFPIAGFKKHKNGATTELKLRCELPLNVKKKKNLKKERSQPPTPSFHFFCGSFQRELYLWFLLIRNWTNVSSKQNMISHKVIIVHQQKLTPYGT